MNRIIYQKTANCQVYCFKLDDPAVKEHFREKQAKTRKRKGVKDLRGQIVDRVPINERPKIVEERSRAADWEGDTIESAGKKPI